MVSITQFNNLFLEDPSGGEKAIARLKKELKATMGCKLSGHIGEDLIAKLPKDWQVEVYKWAMLVSKGDSYDDPNYNYLLAIKYLIKSYDWICT